jgi:hypothetical protein
MFIEDLQRMFPTKLAHFVPIRSKTWPLQAILVSDWWISKKKKFYSETALPK